ncbi:MAG: hypothetical protein H6738_08770 [Alphaproteobacteria bacterium]|nr:hypothetical protein [Alphaproteobacteria bacterium]MCB9696853.1 hypothetical protein [Alphaproteobacteria bacterium]
MADLALVGPAEAHAGDVVELVASAPATWWRRVTEALDYDNVAACGGVNAGCVQPLVFRWERLPDRGASLSVVAEEGTWRFAATDGSAPVDVGLELVVRRDDTYVGYLTELLGTPFALVPARLPDGHQTDLRLAADCVAVLIYGRRRLGEDVPYVSPAGVRRWLVAAEGPARRGDVLHFGFQTAVLSEDHEPVGVIDPGDVVLQAFHGRVEERPLRDLPYAGLPFDHLRWRADAPR